MSAEFIYTTNPSKIPAFLEKLRAAGKPEKVTLQTIASLGFKSTNDRALLPILKGLGFVDGSGVPTQRWAAFRSNHKAAIGEGIREHYAKLFSLYPDAYQKDNEALHSFFSTHTSVGEGALRYMISTFKTLCSLAAFDQPPARHQRLPPHLRSEHQPQSFILNLSSPLGRAGQ
jgi:Family of unknown function (DUF5343)